MPAILPLRRRAPPKRDASHRAWCCIPQCIAAGRRRCRRLFRTMPPIRRNCAGFGRAGTGGGMRRNYWFCGSDGGPPTGSGLVRPTGSECLVRPARLWRRDSTDAGFLARHSACGARSAQVARVHARRAADAGARHRREHRDLLADGSAAAAQPAGEKPVGADPAGWPGAVSGPDLQQADLLVPDVQGLPGREPGVLRPARAVSDDHDDVVAGAVGSGARRPGDGKLLRGAGRAARRSAGCSTPPTIACRAPIPLPSSATASGSAALPAIPSVLNQTITVNGHPLTIVGVSAAGFSGLAGRQRRGRDGADDDEGADDADLERPRQPPQPLADRRRSVEAGDVASSRRRRR